MYDPDFYGKMRGFLGVVSKIGVFIEKSGVWGVYGQNLKVLMEKLGFSGKIKVFSKNGVFVGFWSRIQGKVGKSREFDDFWKIGKNREK